jgi:hypothetical protein
MTLRAEQSMKHLSDCLIFATLCTATSNRLPWLFVSNALTTGKNTG